MTLDDVIGGLHLSAAATRASRRVPKNQVIPHLPRKLGRAFDEGTEALRWVATLKPGTTAHAAGALALSTGAPVPVPELLVFTLDARSGARLPAVVEAVHRAVHMHMLLLLVRDGALHLSVAPKRGSLADKHNVVLAGAPLSAPPVDLAAPRPQDTDLLAALALDCRPEPDLAALHQRWAAALVAAKVAEVSGHFRLVLGPEALADRAALLAQHQQRMTELATLLRALKQATQIAQRVDLSTRLKHAEAQLARVRALL